MENDIIKMVRMNNFNSTKNLINSTTIRDVPNYEAVNEESYLSFYLNLIKKNPPFRTYTGLIDMNVIGNIRDERYQFTLSELQQKAFDEVLTVLSKHNEKSFTMDMYKLREPWLNRNIYHETIGKYADLIEVFEQLNYFKKTSE